MKFLRALKLSIITACGLALSLLAILFWAFVIFAGSRWLEQNVGGYALLWGVGIYVIIFGLICGFIEAFSKPDDN